MIFANHRFLAVLVVTFMSKLSSLLIKRRRLLQLGLGGGIAVAGIAVGDPIWRRVKAKILPPPKLTWNPSASLREFEYGTLKQENGRQIREFKITSNTTEILLDGASFTTWSYNGRVPGPTLRANQGDRIRVIYTNQHQGEDHSIHFHGIHKAQMDGMEPINYGKTTVYEFDAKPFGLHLYHCHIGDVAYHIGQGLYGMFIIDPPGGRPQADEIAITMSGYDTNGDGKNEFVVFNGFPQYYMKHPITVKQNQLVRLYLLNIIEYEPAVSFHLHANLFQVYRTGSTLQPTEATDVITMGTAERHILEFSYSDPGMYMFHPHQDWVAQKGCEGMFHVHPA